MTLPMFDEANSSQFRWHPSRKAGLRRLSEFVPNAGRAYAAKRNFDFGPCDRSNVSALSPWVRHRLITEQEILRAVLARHSVSPAEKFVQEVFWRGYFKGWLEHRPSIWQCYKEDLDRLIGELRQDESLAQRYRAAVDGQTGIECFDAWAKELAEIGYLHNHTRMWFASIWIFTLGLPWQLGADFFYRHLLDGDAASNTLSWRWVGGLHTKGKTYLARADNIARYTADRFNPRGELATTAPPLLEDADHPVIGLPADTADMTRGRWGILVTEEACHVPEFSLPGQAVAATGLAFTDARSSLPVSEKAREFGAGAVASALHRIADEYGISTEQPLPDSWPDSLATWAAKNDLDVVATAYAPIGPVADQLKIAESRLKLDGRTLVQRVSPYDALVWPYATGGFFKLKKQIPYFLESMGLKTVGSRSRRG